MKICLATALEEAISFTCDGSWDSTIEEGKDEKVTETLPIGVFESKNKRFFTFNKVLATCETCIAF